jgi:tRNA threonylcarbamoyladenosine biosynthesis protein TsaB
MLILTIRTDKPEAEIGLFEDNKQLVYLTWQAHRQLAETIHLKLCEMLKSENHTLSDLEGIVVFQGPGSFTGLRISLSAANALADSLQIPIVGQVDKDWAQQGITRLRKGDNDRIIIPEYGALPHITQPKH